MKRMQLPDARGWVGLSVFVLTVMVLWMVAAFPELRHDEFFKVLATAIVLTGYVGGPVGWAYSATKQGGELAERNASIVEQSATAAAAATAPAAEQVRQGARDGTRQGVEEGLSSSGVAAPATDDRPSYAR
jgi:hypothetical protein